MRELVPSDWRLRLERLRDELAGVFDRWSRRRRSSDVVDVHDAQSVDRFWSPSVFTTAGLALDLEDRGEDLRVTAELPGLSREDLRVELSRGQLVLRGEKRSRREEPRGHYHVSECRYGSFRRLLPLPCDVKIEKAEARYRNRVLTIRLHKSDEERARRIQVDVV